MPAVYLKADDLRLDAVSKNWKRFLSFCASEGIHCNAGVIARNTPALDGARVNEVRAELDALGFGRSWTVWNHGVDHRRVRETHTSDFCGMPLASQIDALRRAQDFVERLTGVRMNAFGAPFNWWDHNTLLALQRFPEIRYVFHIPYVPGKRCYGSELFVEAEPFLGKVRPGARRTFALDEAKRKSERFLSIERSFVLQVHPGRWDHAGFDAFASFVEHVRSAGYVFRPIGDPQDDAPGGSRRSSA